jgi:hypothetical protein
VEPVGTAKIGIALRNRHSGSSWAYFEELRTKTGYSGHVGYIDAYAIGLWNENRSFIAYEVKATRGDFKSDVEQFSSKQASAVRNSTQFYYACPHGVIKPEEVPDVAGLIWVDAGGAKAKKVAPVRELPGNCLDIDFTMALLRAAAGAPAKKTVAFKYLGKEITEEELVALATDLGKRLGERDVKFLAREEAAKRRIKSRAVLLKVCQALGFSGSDMDYLAVEAMADKIIAGFASKNEDMRLCGNILYNAKSISKAAAELERLTLERQKMEVKDAKPDSQEGRGA